MFLLLHDNQCFVICAHLILEIWRNENMNGWHAGQKKERKKTGRQGLVYTTALPETDVSVDQNSWHVPLWSKWSDGRQVVGSCPTVLTWQKLSIHLFFTSSVRFLAFWPARGDCGWSVRQCWLTQSWRGWQWTVCGLSCICTACPPSCGWWLVVLCLWTWPSPLCLVSRSKSRGTGSRRHEKGWSGGWTRIFPAPAIKTSFQQQVATKVKHESKNSNSNRYNQGNSPPEQHFSGTHSLFQLDSSEQWHWWWLACWTWNSALWRV